MRWRNMTWNKDTDSKFGEVVWFVTQDMDKYHSKEMTLH